MIVASIVVTAFEVYFAIGLVFAIAFAARGAAAIDSSADHAPIGFRILLVPGAAALWPFLFVRWARARRTA